MHQNTIQVERVAIALAHLREHVVFIGGAIVGLLITDSGSPEPRKTKDVDLIIEIAGLSSREKIEEELRGLGFQHDISKTGHMLRWKLDELIVDILPPDGSVFGMKTHWYPEALEAPVLYKLGDGTVIKLINGPLFLCTKFHAFADRGENNFQESKDIGDVLAVIEGRPELEGEMPSVSDDAKNFIKSEVKKLREHPEILDILEWQIFDHGRHDIVKARLDRLSNL